MSQSERKSADIPGSGFYSDVSPWELKIIAASKLNFTAGYKHFFIKLAETRNPLLAWKKMWVALRGHEEALERAVLEIPFPNWRRYVDASEFFIQEGNAGIIFDLFDRMSHQDHPSIMYTSMHMLRISLIEWDAGLTEYDTPAPPEDDNNAEPLQIKVNASVRPPGEKLKWLRGRLKRYCDICLTYYQPMFDWKWESEHPDLLPDAYRLAVCLRGCFREEWECFREVNGLLTKAIGIDPFMDGVLKRYSCLYLDEVPKNLPGQLKPEDEMIQLMLEFERKVEKMIEAGMIDEARQALNDAEKLFPALAEFSRGI